MIARRCGPAPGERGAAAVELGLVAGVVLIPLLVGVLQWGDYLWKAQRVDTISPAIPSGEVVGTFTCAGLKDAVARSVVTLVNDLDPETGDISLSDVTVTVVEVLPDVGVTLEIHIETSAGGLASLVPLPGGGALVTDFSQRIADVRVSDVTCR